jgi:DNA-binding GntR family transcriptional regulator
MSRSNKIRIPDKVLKEIFPKKLRRLQYSDRLYAKLKNLILSGKLKKGQKLIQNKVARDLNMNIPSIRPVFQQLKKDRLIISRGRRGSIVA